MGYLCNITLMKYRTPMMGEYIQPRKASNLNLENLFATLLHLINLHSPSYKGFLTAYIGLVFNRMTILYGHDPVAFIAEVKLVRSWFLSYIRGGGSDGSGFSYERWADDQLVPELLRDLKQTVDSCSRVRDFGELLFFYRILFTLLNADRVVVLPPNPNYDTITSKCTVKIGGEGWPSSNEISVALGMLGIKKTDFNNQYSLYCKDFQYEILNSVGPNGQQTWSAHLDARAWANANLLWPKFRSFLEESKLTQILKDIVGCIRIDSNEIKPLAVPRLGKLAVIPEWGGKTRIVGELDYWSQMALSPLHNTINHFLKLVTQDGTFDQERIALTVREWTSDPNSEIYSYDLTAATDRIPIEYQRDILCQLLKSHSMAKNWLSLMTSRRFIGPDGVDRQYLTGQPMGARSSFPMLALCHHVLVMVAAQRAGLEAFKDYVILGDDMTMNNARVASHYKALVTSLGVGIDLNKSVVATTGLIPAGEICRRVFVNGIELSMFNAKLIVKTIKDGRLAPTLQNDLLRRGWEPTEEKFWIFMAAVLDRDNLGTLIKLNLVPKDLSGLIRCIKPSTPFTDLNKWFDEVTLTNNDLVQLQTFVLASDQLKRLDTVLRAANTLTDALGAMAAHQANPKAIPENIRNIWLTEILDEKQMAAMKLFLEDIGPIHYNHPLVSAARAETNRISSLLHSLNSFDSDMVMNARHGLLEACRSAIGSMWDWGKEPPVQEQRSIFLRVLTVLNQLVQKGRSNPTARSAWSMTYSVTLTSMGRLWNVNYKLGGHTTVNALRASVSRNITEASSVLSKALNSVLFDTAAKTSNVGHNVENLPSSSENLHPHIASGVKGLPEQSNPP